MRKDVKLGLGVGLILFAVVVMYLVVAGGRDKRGAEFAQGTTNVEAAPQNGTGDPAPPVGDRAATPPGADAAAGGGDASSWAMLARETDPRAQQAIIEHARGGGATDVPAIHTMTPPAGGAAAHVDPAPRREAARDGGAAREPGSVRADLTPATRPSSSRTHIVKQGDSLWTIAQAEYGNGALYTHIQKANPNVNPNHLSLGQSLVIPDFKAEMARGTSPISLAPSDFHDGRTTPAEVRSHHPLTIDASGTYRVEQGDSLYGISRKQCGDGRLVDAIYELNRDQIGADKSRLKLGMVLRLPRSDVASGAH